MEKTAFHLMGIWVVSLVAKTYLNWQSGDYMQFDFKIGEGNNFLFMAAIVYIISQIFKRGIEMQEENELTV